MQAGNFSIHRQESTKCRQMRLSSEMDRGRKFRSWEHFDTPQRVTVEISFRTTPQPSNQLADLVSIPGNG
jgi:hypothetical protein